MDMTTAKGESTAQDFHVFMREIMQSMRMLPPHHNPPEVYSFHFQGQADVHVFNTVPGRLDVLAKAGTVADLKNPATLLKLLEMNRFDSRNQPVSVGIDPEKGTITLWSFHPLAGLNRTKFESHLKAVLDKAARVQLHLNNPPPMPARKSGGLESRGIKAASIR